MTMMITQDYLFFLPIHYDLKFKKKDIKQTD